MNRSPLRAFLLIPLVLACFALSLTARAVTPAPDGGYPNANTAEGEDALFSLDTSQGGDNTANGFQALFFNTTGYQNTANGASALFNNTTGFNNTANGFQALFFNTTGYQNTVNGGVALAFNTTGYQNTATGFAALLNNTTGFNNTADGWQALFNNNGNNNIAVGANAGFNLTTGNFNIDIGNSGVAGDSKRIRIGTTGTQTKTFIAGISGATVASGVGVIVGSNGQLGTVVSSNRFKDAIKPMDKASEVILALKPVTFRYKPELDPEGIPQFGLVAEQVEKVNPDLVARDEEGKPYTVRYEAVNAMLLNEFLKEHKAFVELKKEIAALRVTVKEQASQIQRMSADLEATKSSAQMVVNNQ